MPISPILGFCENVDGKRNNYFIIESRNLMLFNDCPHIYFFFVDYIIVFSFQCVFADIYFWTF